jgi:hypothetical protein
MDFTRCVENVEFRRLRVDHDDQAFEEPKVHLTTLYLSHVGACSDT